MSDNDQVVEVRRILSQLESVTSDEKDDLARILSDIHLSEDSKQTIEAELSTTIKSLLLADDSSGKLWLIVFVGNLESYGVSFIETLKQVQQTGGENLFGISHKDLIEPAIKKILAGKNQEKQK